MIMIQSFNVVLEDMEVRKIEQVEISINDKIFNSLDVHFDDASGNRLVFKDKNINNVNKYQRGIVGSLILNINTENVIKKNKNGNSYISEKTYITIKDFIKINI